mgnify:CR=1 FL=1
MDTLNLKFRLLLLLVTVGTVLGSCAYDDDEKMYSSRSYDETYALLRPYIMSLSLVQLKRLPIR